jgi:hypothetical protein
MVAGRRLFLASFEEGVGAFVFVLMVEVEVDDEATALLEAAVDMLAIEKSRDDWRRTGHAGNYL